MIDDGCRWLRLAGAALMSSNRSRSAAAARMIGVPACCLGSGPFYDADLLLAPLFRFRSRFRLPRLTHGECGERGQR